MRILVIIFLVKIIDDVLKEVNDLYEELANVSSKLDVNTAELKGKVENIKDVKQKESFEKLIAEIDFYNSELNELNNKFEKLKESCEDFNDVVIEHNSAMERLKRGVEEFNWFTTKEDVETFLKNSELEEVERIQEGPITNTYSVDTDIITIYKESAVFGKYYEILKFRQDWIAGENKLYSIEKVFSNQNCIEDFCKLFQNLSDILEMQYGEDIGGFLTDEVYDRKASLENLRRFARDKAVNIENMVNYLKNKDNYYIDVWMYPETSKEAIKLKLDKNCVKVIFNRFDYYLE